MNGTHGFYKWRKVLIREIGAFFTWVLNVHNVALNWGYNRICIRMEQFET
jgi:hypothetical protein